MGKLGMLASAKGVAPRSGRLALVVGVAVLAVGFVRPAAATQIVLSQLSSDATDPLLLDATLDFDVSGQTLTVTVHNQTMIPAEYNVVEIFFNSSNDITDLTLDSAEVNACPGSQCRWELFAESGMTGPTVADGFGFYDWALKSTHSSAKVTPNEISVFEFTISGKRPFTMSDFGTELSTAPPGDTPALAAAKFVNGPGDDSAFGATVPEPGTAALVAMGLAGLALLGRKRD